MISFLKVGTEAIRQAWQQMAGNKLRTFLSLLGISIGILCIIGVQTAAGSLERDVRDSMNKLGNDVIYVQKFSWSDVNNKWWEYLRRPNIDYDDYLRIREDVKTAEVVAYQLGLGMRTAQFKNSSAEGAYLFAVSEDYDQIYDLDLEQGRFFSASEFRYGVPKCVLGFEVAKALFDGRPAVGKQIKVRGKTMEVLGVIASAGDDMVNPLDFDQIIMIAYPYAQKIANLDFGNGWSDSSVNVKAAAGVPVERLKDDIIGALRAERRLKPREDNNFSLNELSIVSDALGQVFGVLNVIGFIIGGFAILVGGFSVANIMFVSVKERTNLIGIKKAIGAKPGVILLEFLIESVVLCVVGGAMGLALVGLGVLAAKEALPFPLVMTMGNVIWGLTISVIIGLVAGVIPAWQAARMDPVEAIRA